MNDSECPSVAHCGPQDNGSRQRPCWLARAVVAKQPSVALLLPIPCSAFCCAVESTYNTRNLTATVRGIRWPCALCARCSVKGTINARAGIYGACAGLSGVCRSKIDKMRHQKWATHPSLFRRTLGYTTQDTKLGGYSRILHFGSELRPTNQ
jgi:hypothetical protein